MILDYDRDELPAVIRWIVGIVCLVLAGVLLSGCGGGANFKGTCGAIPLGQNEEGVLLLRVVCKAAE